MLDGNAAVGLAPAGAVADQSLVESKVRIEGQLKGAAGWFFAIAVLSLINSIIILFGGKWHFIIGLGITSFFDAIAMGINNAVANVAVFVINVIILTIPVIFGIFARKGHKWPFIVGMVLYGIDALILLLFQDWLSAAFHVYVLFMLYRGIGAIALLGQIRQASLASTPTPIQP